MPYHTLFLHSDLGLQGDALGPDSSSSIVRKIVLETGPGTQVNDFHSLPTILYLCSPLRLGTYILD